MTNWTSQRSGRLDKLVARLFGIVMLFSFTAGISILVWQESGGTEAAIVFGISTAMFLPRFVHAWRTMGETLL